MPRGASAADLKKAFEEYDYTEAYDELDSYATTSSGKSQARMNLGNIDGTTWKGRGNAACKKASATSTNHTGRDDRATTEQVMDPRTRMILFKLLSTGFLDEIHGCISTGKEANVYYAKAGESGHAMMQRAAGAQEGEEQLARIPKLRRELRLGRRPEGPLTVLTRAARACALTSACLLARAPLCGRHARAYR